MAVRLLFDALLKIFNNLNATIGTFENPAKILTFDGPEDLT